MNALWWWLRDYWPYITGTIAAISVFVGVLAFLANRKSQREALVQKAYYDYAKMAVDWPELAFPPRQRFDFKGEELNESNLEFER
jgi:hypothetical protein